MGLKFQGEPLSLQQAKAALAEVRRSVDEVSTETGVLPPESTWQVFEKLKSALQQERSPEAARLVCYHSRILVLDYMGLTREEMERAAIPKLTEVKNALDNSLKFIDCVLERLSSEDPRIDDCKHFKRNLEVRVKSLEISTSDEPLEKKTSVLLKHLGLSSLVPN